MLEDRGAQHDKVVVDKYTDIRANYAMNTRDYVVRTVTNHLTGAITLTLPPVAEAKGRFYSIVARQADNVNTVTIVHRADSECWANIVLNGKCDKALLYSDGLCWHQLTVLTFQDTEPPTTAAPTTAAPTTGIA